MACSFINTSHISYVKVDPQKIYVSQSIEKDPNPKVDYFVEYFQTTRRPFLVQALERRKELGPEIREILSEFSLPKSLEAVAIVESGMDEYATSPSGAKGLWQLMKPTAEQYGLETFFLFDQRVDVEVSTIAASKHLLWLYDRFGDWQLALAAYNAGSSRVNRAIKKTGSRDFFLLASKGHFPEETASFVPKVLAVSRILEDPVAYGFSKR